MKLLKQILIQNIIILLLFNCRFDSNYLDIELSAKDYRCLEGIIELDEKCNGDEKNKINHVNGECNLRLIEMISDCS
ncbi:hypothetical protein [Leptospira kirschneri]|uniref:hypothetical protein n=1 Tax=Leptospira kirschneri TaxID=29507 RepID=UPI0035666109